MKKFLKWLFTRWYYYIIVGIGALFNKDVPTILYNPAGALGALLGIFFIWGTVLGLFYFLELRKKPNASS